MCRISLIILFVVMSLTAFSQSLTLDELIKLRNKDVGEINDFLLKKGWYYDTNEDDVTVWKYKDRNSGIKLTSFSLAAAAYSDTLVYFQTRYIEYYNILHSRIIDFKMKKTSTSINPNDKRIVTEYEGANYIVTTEIIPHDGENVYLVSVRKK